MRIESQDINSRPDFSHDLRLYDSVSFEHLHIHKSSELIYIDSGELELSADDRKFELSEGEAALILPFVPHCFRAINARFTVHLFGKRFAGEFHRIVSARITSVPVFTPSSASVEYYRHCFGLSNTQYRENDCIRVNVTCTDYTASSGLSAMLAQFLIGARLEANPKSELRRELLEYIERHCCEELTLASLADRFGYEPHYLSRLVSHSTGMHLKQLINGFRIEKAKEQLTGDKPITEIALSCGFGSLRSFDRSFAELVGIPPCKWRQENCKQNV